MYVRKALIPVACVLMAMALSVAGCVCGNTGTTPTPTPVATLTPTVIPTGGPGGTVTPVATTSPTPSPALSAELSGWGTDKDSYARGENATGWVNVRNTGDQTIDSMDFALNIHRSVFLIGEYSVTYHYNMTGLDIRPGETEKVQFVQQIPAEYKGLSTAGSYSFDVTAFLAGKVAGSYSRNVQIV